MRFTRRSEGEERIEKLPNMNYTRENAQVDGLIQIDL
jgi:hypothetical protein